MGNMNIYDILMAIKKRMHIIVICMIIAAVLAYFAGNRLQSYTADMNLEYQNAEAKEGKAPDNSPLNPYEIMNPAVISQAIKNLDVKADITVEEVRNKLSIREVVDASTSEVQKASAEKGEVFEVNPTEYSISYNYKATFGEDFGNRLLYSLVEAYDEWFMDEYYTKTNVTNFMANVDVKNMEYLEICDYIESSTIGIIETLTYLEEENPNFRSMGTGLNFKTLKVYYQSILDISYQKYFSNTRAALLAKDAEKLIKSYKDKINNYKLPMANAQNDSDLAFKMISTFYEQYKQSSLYQQATNTQGTVTGSNSDNKTVVYDYDLTLMINTYDDIVTRYVNSGVDASILRRDAEYFTKIITDYENDNVPLYTKDSLTKINDELLADITQDVATYAKLANETIDDFYRNKVTNDLSYIMAISVRPELSVSLITMLGIIMGLIGGMVLCIFIEIFILSMDRRKNENSSKQNAEITAEMIQNMSATERAFYEQSSVAFNEFYIVYQLMVSADGTWSMSEAFARWKSSRIGEVGTGEFLAIAEQYGLMDELGVWTLEMVCKQLKLWESSEYNRQMISVNYSVSQIQSKEFVDSLCSVISKTGANPENLCFEISGGGEILDLSYVEQKLMMLKAIGCKVAIDRFGDTLSSIRALYDLPIDYVKISRKYVDTLEEGRVDPFLTNVLGICKERNIQVGIMGVENQQQDEMLRNLGVDWLQGYFYSAPQKFVEHQECIQKWNGINTNIEPVAVAVPEPVAVATPEPVAVVVPAPVVVEPEIIAPAPIVVEDYELLFSPIVRKDGVWGICQATTKVDNAIVEITNSKAAELQKLKKALEQINIWLHEEIATPVIAVSLSVQMLLENGFADEVTAMVVGSGIKTSMLLIGIDANVATIDSIAKLATIKNMGVRLALYNVSNISQIHNVPVDLIRVDAGFALQNVDNSFTTIVNYCKNNRVLVCASGVNTAEHDSLIRQMGVSFTQGELYGEGMTAAQYFGWLARLSRKKEGSN